MTDEEIQFKDLTIVGYADTLDADLLPRLVVPIFQVRAKPDEFVLPPFIFKNDRVTSFMFSTRSDFEKALSRGQATQIAPIPAQPHHQLWIDQDFVPRYQPEAETATRLRTIAKQYARLAKESIERSDYEAASRLAQVAISADERCLDALLVKAIVRRVAGAEHEVDVLTQIADVVAPDVDFRSWVNLYFRIAANDRPSPEAQPPSDDEYPIVRLVFGDAASAIDPAKLGDFLCLFRGVYAAALQALAGSVSRIQQSVDRKIRSHLRRLDVRAIDSLFTADLGDDRLATLSLSFHSPFEMSVSGRGVALFAAIEMARGEFQDGERKLVMMPDLQSASRALRLSLLPSLKTPVGFGVRIKYVTLSDDEMRELMRHDPRSEYRGGFQRFIIGLQYRVNRETLDLPLLESDIQFILKYGAQARKGGWQSSIKKIFSRHFDFSTGEPIERDQPTLPIRRPRR